MRKVPCISCGGGGVNTVWDPKKKTYVTVPCRPCGGRGHHIIGTE